MKKPLFAVLLIAMPLFAVAQNPTNLPAYPGATQTATPLSVGEKFNYRVVQSLGLRGFGGAALSAGVSQWADVPHEWGQGMEGYGTRFGSAFGGNLSRQSMAFVLEGALHEDPRYFPSTQKGFKARMKSVLIQTLVTRKDGGGNRFAYGRIGSAFAAGQLVNAWQPGSNGSVGDGLERGLITLGGDAGYNFLQEFIPFLRPRSLRH
jgi:hypothetical protein